MPSTHRDTSWSLPMTCRTRVHRFLASNFDIVSATAKGSVFTTRTASALAVDASGTATGLEENKERTKLDQVSILAGDKGDQAKAGSVYRLDVTG